jgi:hypothetical protein
VKPALRIAGIGLVIGALGAVVYGVSFGRSGSKPRPKPSVDKHADEIDSNMAQLNALSHAPEGATPCESGWNAIVAEQNAAKAQGEDSIFTYVAPHDEFIAICQSLPPDAQKCMAPSYTAAHREDCARMKPPPEVLDKMRKLRPDLDGSKQPQQGQQQPPPSSSKP